MVQVGASLQHSTVRGERETKYSYFEVNFQPLRDGFVQVRVGGYEDVLVVSHVVGDGGRGDVGELGPGDGQAAVVIHGDGGVVVLHLSQHVVQVVNTELRALHLLPTSRQTLR